MHTRFIIWNNADLNRIHLAVMKKIVKELRDEGKTNEEIVKDFHDEGKTNREIARILEIGELDVMAFLEDKE